MNMLVFFICCVMLLLLRVGCGVGGGSDVDGGGDVLVCADGRGGGDE